MNTYKITMMVANKRMQRIAELTKHMGLGIEGIGQGLVSNFDTKTKWTKKTKDDFVKFAEKGGVKIYDIKVNLLDDDDGSDDGVIQPLWSGWQWTYATLRVRYFPESGGFTVTDTMGYVHIHDVSSWMNGTIYIQANARLELDNVNLFFNGDYINQRAIIIDNGGYLKISNNSVMHANYNLAPSVAPLGGGGATGTGHDGSASTMYWLLKNYGELRLENSTVRNVGCNDIESWMTLGGVANGITN